MNYKKYIELLKTPKAFIEQVLLVIELNYLRLMAHIMPDKMYLRCKYRFTYRKRLHLRKPQLFSEKLQWIKLHDRKPIYHQMVDKYDAKRFIASRVGDEYNIPVLGVYMDFEEIDFNQLPNQFILKCTFDSGSYYICKDKSQLDIARAKKRLLQNWNDDYYIWSREWPYKGLQHRIIAEPLIANPEDLKEFKLFCFNGNPKLFQSIFDRQGEGGPILQHFDMNGQRLDIKDKHYKSRQGKAEKNILPKSLETLCSLSKNLSSDTLFLRVDFFEVKDKIYVGELTFYESGGFVDFTPEQYNRILGDWIELPN